MKYDDFDGDMKLEFKFIICEMALIFFKHKTKMQNFNVFCNYIRETLMYPPYNVKSLKNGVLYNLNNFIIFNLHRQYGIDIIIASDIISDFFVERIWCDIYKIQEIINNETLPSGYA